MLLGFPGVVSFEIARCTVGERPGCSVLPEGSELCLSDGTRVMSEKLLTFSGMCFVELDDPGISHLQVLQTWILGTVSLDVVGRVNANRPPLPRERKTS